MCRSMYWVTIDISAEHSLVTVWGAIWLYKNINAAQTLYMYHQHYFKESTLQFHFSHTQFVQMCTQTCQASTKLCWDIQQSKIDNINWVPPGRMDLISQLSGLNYRIYSMKWYGTGFWQLGEFNNLFVSGF